MQISNVDKLSGASSLEIELNLLDDYLYNMNKRIGKQR